MVTPMRFLAAVPMKSTTSAECAAAFAEGWIQYFGTPAYATSDNASYFVSRLWKDIHAKLGTIIGYSPLYRPQSVGMIERQHAPLKTGLRAALLAMNDEYGSQWKSMLPWVLLGRRTSFHDELKATPAQMVFGQDPPLPGPYRCLLMKHSEKFSGGSIKLLTTHRHKLLLIMTHDITCLRPQKQRHTYILRELKPHL